MQPTYNTIDPREIEYSSAKATNFRVFINAFPYLSFYTTDAMVPGINLAGTKIQSPTGSINISDNKIEYDPITLGFIVDEQYNSYKEVYNWMLKHGSPTSGRKQNSEIEPVEVYIVALDNNKNPVITFKYVNVRPVSLGELTLNVQGENEVVTCDVTCMYTYVQIETKTSDIPTNISEAGGALMPA